LLELGLVDPAAAQVAGATEWRAALARFTPDVVATETGISADRIRQAAIIYGTGGLGLDKPRPDAGYPPALIYQTAAHLGEAAVS
jgi:hypothetical protein